jgi:hypothetical protein
MRCQTYAFILAVLLVNETASIVNGKGAFLRKFDESCTSLLWLVGFQNKADGGGEVFYLADSNDYVDHLKVAILSARKNAPALVPVIVFTGAMSGNAALVSWIESNGGYVMHHKISFVRELKLLASDPKYKYSKNLWGSWLRIDIVAIMSQVEKMMTKLAASGYQVPTYSRENILWTDPDVIFEGPIDSCTLPRPFILSVGPEVGMGTAKNYGVIYFNVASYSAMSMDMLDWAKKQHYHFEHDQDLMLQFIGARVNSLPDAYNWKLYWGNTSTARGPRFPGSEIKILHFHGPKLKLATCFFEKLKAFENPYAVPVSQQREVVRVCGLNTSPGRGSGGGKGDIDVQQLSVQYVALLAKILFNAFTLDEGDFYFDVERKFMRYKKDFVLEESHGSLLGGMASSLKSAPGRGRQIAIGNW